MTYGSTYQEEVSVLGRLDIFHTTKEPPSCVAGAPTALGPRVSRGALRTAAGDALRLPMPVVTHDHVTPAQARLD